MKDSVEMGFPVEVDIPAYWNRGRIVSQFPGCKDMFPAVPGTKIAFAESFPAVILICGKQKYITSTSLLRVIEKDGRLFYRLILRYLQK